MKRVVALSILSSVFIAAGAGAVTSITVEAAGVQATTTAYTAGVETFDSVTGYTSPYATSFGGSPFAGNFDQVTGTSADQFGGAGGTGHYITVNGDSILTVSGPKTDYFGLWASALDGGNAIAFYKAGSLVDNINLTAFSLASGYSGNPTAPFLGQNTREKYAFFNFVVAGGYDEVHLIQNGGGGFEIDNVTVGSTTPVPEPQSWAMLIAGLGIVGASLRRRRGSVAA